MNAGATASGATSRAISSTVSGAVSGAGDDIEKLGKALAAEHAALFAYGVLAARTSGSLRAKMSAAYDAHRARRDQLRSYITSRGGRPVEPEASYMLPFIPSNATLAAKLAVHLESGMTAAYLELAAAQDVKLRRYAALAMQESVTRSYSFRPDPPAAFPGMPPPATPPATPAGG